MLTQTAEPSESDIGYDILVQDSVAESKVEAKLEAGRSSLGTLHNTKSDINRKLAKANPHSTCYKSIGLRTKVAHCKTIDVGGFHDSDLDTHCRSIDKKTSCAEPQLPQDDPESTCI